ncbi:MAG: hypothetical protein Q7U83_06850 [Daejeonella sp.]|nr:hypothetical protein [Daejeonella sp.]
MKANHNFDGLEQGGLHVVVNISKSKNESKSQRRLIEHMSLASCGKYQ